MTWTQVYNPTGNLYLSALLAAIPVVVLLGSLAFFHVKAHVAALLGLATALAVAVLLYGMPASTAVAAAGNGAPFGLFPIGWIVLNAIFVYDITVRPGSSRSSRRPSPGWPATAASRSCSSRSASAPSSRARPASERRWPSRPPC